MPGRTFTYETVVRETQLDAFGHMNHARYLEVFEDARWDFINHNGYGLERIRATGLGPTILEIKVRYRKELLPGRKIAIESQTLSYEGKIARLAQRMLDEDGVECCTAELVIGLFDIKARRLVQPTEEWKRAVGLDGGAAREDRETEASRARRRPTSRRAR
jgi:acyl-CoA thioester hydrolase